MSIIMDNKVTDKDIINVLNGRTNKNHTTIIRVFSEDGNAKDIVITIEDIVDLINRLQTENKELHDAFYNKDRIKVVQTKAIKEFIEKCVLTFACGRSDDRTECYICENDFLEIMKEMVGEG